MFEAWVRWRISYKADSIDPMKIRRLLRKEIMVLGGKTKDNCITLVVRPCFHDPNEQELETLIQYGIFIIERTIRQIEKRGLAPRINCIYDRTNMTSANRDSGLIKFAMRMLTMLQDFYCERLGNFFVINANWAFWIAHKLVKPFLAKKTRDKMKLIYKMEELDAWIAPEERFVFHGGTKEYSYDPCEDWDLQREEITSIEMSIS